MTPINFHGANGKLTPPPNWDEAKRGRCVDLHVERHEGGIRSVWEFSDEERAIIAAGGGIVLNIASHATHPAVSLAAVQIAMTDESMANAEPVDEKRCESEQYGDLTLCRRCDLKWDTNDLHPPMCGKTVKA